MDMGRRDLDVGSNNYVIVEIMQVNMLELVHVEVLIVEVKWSVWSEYWSPGVCMSGLWILYPHCPFPSHYHDPNGYWGYKGLSKCAHTTPIFLFFYACHF